MVSELSQSKRAGVESDVGDYAGSDTEGNVGDIFGSTSGMIQVCDIWVRMRR